jgi:2-oxo-4-hydroxy-4-carboxy-5-ureidoimidazoline decarboxylase
VTNFLAEMTLEWINTAERDEFIERLGGVYEESSWVAKRAFAQRPFNSLDQLRRTMKSVVDAADRERRLDLLRAHPDLGEQTEMTEASKQEQASAGLDELSPDRYETFQWLNEMYREKFGFPFIKAVKNATPDIIQESMETRVDLTPSQEFDNALEQVHKIARFRLDELVST